MTLVNIRCVANVPCLMSVLSGLTDACAWTSVKREHLRAGSTETRADRFFLLPDATSQDCYDIPRAFASDRSSSLEGFHNQYVSMTDHWPWHFRLFRLSTPDSKCSHEMKVTTGSVGTGEILVCDSVWQWLCLLREMYVSFRKSRTCWQRESSQVKNWTRTMSP